jgi:hypothetical protein
MTSAIVRCPCRELRGRSGWVSDSMRVSLIRSLISAIILASRREACRGHRGVEPFVSLDAAAAGLDVALHASTASSTGCQVLLGSPCRSQCGEFGLERASRALMISGSCWAWLRSALMTFVEPAGSMRMTPSPWRTETMPATSMATNA